MVWTFSKHWSFTNATNAFNYCCISQPRTIQFNTINKSENQRFLNLFKSLLLLFDENCMLQWNNFKHLIMIHYFVIIECFFKQNFLVVYAASIQHELKNTKDQPAKPNSNVIHQLNRVSMETNHHKTQGLKVFFTEMLNHRQSAYYSSSNQGVFEIDQSRLTHNLKM